MTEPVLAAGELDLSDLKAAIRNYFVDRDDIQPDIVEEVVDAGDRLVEELAADALRTRGVHNQWVSRAVEVRGRGAHRVQFQITSWWVDDDLTGLVSSATVTVDRNELLSVS